MRYFDKSPKPFDYRTFEHFAWLPIRIGRETRWLERVKYKAYWFVGWVPCRFIDEGGDE